MMCGYAGMLTRLEFKTQPRAAVWGHSSGSGGGVGIIERARWVFEIAWSASAAAASLTFPGKRSIPHQGSSKAKEI